jgi:hypothetical protein
MDIFKHTIDVLHHVIVPITEHQVAHRFQNPCSSGVGYRANGVLSAIELDDQMSVRAKEVDNKSVDRKLSSKFPVAQAAITEAKPQPPLRVGLVAT